MRKVLAHARDEAKARARSARWCSSATPWRKDSTDCSRRRRRARAARRQGVHVPGRAAIRTARRAFSEIARLTGGAYGAFDAGASARLAALLRAAAAYAAGGHAALGAGARATRRARLLLRRCADGEIGVDSSPSAAIIASGSRVRSRPTWKF